MLFFKLWQLSKEKILNIQKLDFFRFISVVDSKSASDAALQDGLQKQENMFKVTEHKLPYYVFRRTII